MILCVAAIAATGSWAATNMPPVSAEGSEPKVTDVVAKQRYPWNGLVDITCNVSGIVGTTNEFKLALAAVDKLSKAIGLGGVFLHCDDGVIWLKRGSPWAQSLTDATDKTIKRRYINVTAEYLTLN